MATPRAKEFLQAVGNDVVLRQKIEGATSPEERRSIINAAGYADVSREDLQAAVQELAPNAELSDAELEAVAGGATTGWYSFATTVVSAIVVAAVA